MQINSEPPKPPNCNTPFFIAWNESPGYVLQLYIYILGGGFKDFLNSSLFEEMIQFD